jgi:hypothetical protein
MPENNAPFNRRRSDADGNATNVAYRAIAEEAYRLYVADGRDRSRLLTYWELAEKRVAARRHTSPSS